MNEQTRTDWERSLIAFIKAPKAPEPKGAAVRRITTRPRARACKQTVQSGYMSR